MLVFCHNAWKLYLCIFSFWPVLEPLKFFFFSIFNDDNLSLVRYAKVDLTIKPWYLASKGKFKKSNSPQINDKKITSYFLFVSQLISGSRNLVQLYTGLVDLIWRLLFIVWRTCWLRKNVSLHFWGTWKSEIIIWDLFALIAAVYLQ